MRRKHAAASRSIVPLLTAVPKMPPAMQSDDGTQQSDAVEDIMARCLAEADPTQALSAACSSHPEHALALRERFATLRRMELIAGAPSSPSFPERLGEFRLLSEPLTFATPQRCCSLYAAGSLR